MPNRPNPITRIAFPLLAACLCMLPGFSVFAAGVSNSPAAVSVPVSANDGLMHIDAVSVNDPGFTNQWDDVNKQWALAKADFIDAWSTTTGQSSVVIAEIDTGIDAQHEDLSAGQIIAGYDFLNNTLIPAGADSDDNGHGTLVAGVIGATANNFRGIAGADWNVSIMPLKVLDSTGSGNSANVAAAIVYAADHGANIINMSFGGQGFSNDTTLSGAIAYAYNKNVTLVAAAGNDVSTDGGDMDVNPVFPVCDDNGQNMVIGVAATDDNDQKGSFSNFGRSCVDVSAPGVHILSTINIDPATGAADPNGYAYASGTSLAAPYVSAEAALILSKYPTATNREISYRIINSTDPINTLNSTQCDGGPCAGLIGSGRINAALALQPGLQPENVPDGSIVHLAGSTTYYYISGGQKHQISPFVMQQRFSTAFPLSVPQYVLDDYATGPWASPNDGTLIKASGQPTVYEMIGGVKMPVTGQVFQLLGLSFSNVNVLSDAEISSWLTGTFLPPADGTLIRAFKNPTVYWVIDGLLHPINRAFWLQKGLSIFPVVYVPDQDIPSYSQGNAYVR